MVKKLLSNKMVKISAIALCVVFICSIFVFSGCNLNTKTILENTSDFCHCFFYGESEFAQIEFSCGQRECEFEYDGKSTKKIDYGVVKVMFFEDKTQEVFPAQIIISDQVFDVQLEKNPFDASFMFDIEKQVETNQNIIIKIEGYEQCELECVSNLWKIGATKAVELSGVCLKDFLNNTKQQGESFECYLNVVHNVQNGERLYFYTFMVKTTNFKSASVVISPINGEILVKCQTN